MKRLIKLITIPIGLSTLSFGMALAGEDSTYSGQWRRLVDATETTFIQKGICKEKNRDCAHKELVFGSSSPSGISVEIYEIDISTLREIIDLCFLEYEKNNRQMTITLTAYSHSYKDRINKSFSFATVKPYVEMVIKGEK